MTTPRLSFASTSLRRTLAAGVVAMAMLAGAWAAGLVGGDGAPRPLYTLEADGYRYTYHPLSGAEAVFELESDPECGTNLLPKVPAVAARMRSALLRREGAASLEQLRRPHANDAEQLRGLGYL